MRVVWGLVFDDSILHLHESIYERFFSHFGIRSAARRIGHRHRRSHAPRSLFRSRILQLH